VRLRVGEIFKLVKAHGVRELGAEPLRRLVEVFRVTERHKRLEADFGAQDAHHILLVLADAVRHRKERLVAKRSAHQRKPDPGVAASR
jgi:hypothetical protein